jgi:hypothetical protein
MTLPTLVAICAAVQDVVGAVTGIRMAPDTPPEDNAIGGISGYCYPGTGTFTQITAGRAQGLHTLHLVILTPRRHLRTDYARIVGLGDTVPRALLTAGTLAGTIIQTNGIRYTFGALEWGGQQEFGWLFELDVMAIGSLT